MPSPRCSPNGSTNSDFFAPPPSEAVTPTTRPCRKNTLSATWLTSIGYVHTVISGFSFVRKGSPRRARTSSAVSASVTPPSESGLHGVAPGVGMTSGLYEVGLGAGVEAPGDEGACDAIAEDVTKSTPAPNAANSDELLLFSAVSL